MNKTKVFQKTLFWKTKLKPSDITIHKDGRWFVIYPNKVYKVFTGEVEVFYESGTIEHRYTYKKGLKHGTQYRYFEEQNLRLKENIDKKEPYTLSDMDYYPVLMEKYQMRYGKYHGSRQEFNYLGSLIKTSVYKDGVLQE